MHLEAEILGGGSGQRAVTRLRALRGGTEKRSVERAGVEQFASELRARDAGIPIVVMTAAREARQWAEEIRAVGYLAKPFDIDWLIDAVEGALGAPEQSGFGASPADATDATDGDARFSLGSAIARFRGALPGTPTILLRSPAT